MHAHRAEQREDHHAVRALAQTIRVGADFGREYANLVAEGDRRTLLSFAAPGHDRLAMAHGKVDERILEAEQCGHQKSQRLANLQCQPGVEDILRRHTEMETFAGSWNCRAKSLYQRNDHVPGLAVYGGYGVRRDDMGIAVAHDLAGVSFGKHLQFALHVGNSGLDIEPGLQHGRLGPYRAHAGGTKLVLENSRCVDQGQSPALSYLAVLRRARLNGVCTVGLAPFDNLARSAWRTDRPQA